VHEKERGMQSIPPEGNTELNKLKNQMIFLPSA
jgi:hypothetical protein